MRIEWMALLQVSIVTVVATLVLITLAALGTRLLELGRVDSAGSPYQSRYFVAAMALFGACALAVGFGLYLLVPYFH